MPYQDSPGWERQWADFSWEWDFHVSTVSEGHRVVNDRDKSDAKTKGAKLTFGEVLDCGVSRMLHNLGAAHKTSFHDLGMGPGKMLIQTYLQYNNLRCCMGVELAKGRYDLGERNLRTLLKTGWRGRCFLGIEFKKGEFFKIVEDVPNKTPPNGWNIGDKVIAYYPLFKKDKMMIKDYNGVIIDIKKHQSGDDKKNIYSIQYDDGTKCDRVQHRYLFIPGTARTCEVWYGSLFDYPGGFDAELCVLETDFPEEMHPHLIECMTTTPIGCTFLTYHDLKKFKCYDWDKLRQIDCNIYDNDRYITSWSQGWRFYLWEHIPHFNKIRHFIDIKGKLINNLQINDQIIFKRKDDDILQYGEIITISKGTDDEKSDEIDLIIKTNRIEIKKVHYENITISSDEYNIYKTRHRFKINESVMAYFVDNLKDAQYQNRYQIFKAKIIAINANKLSYVIKYTEEGTTKLNVLEKYIYKKPKLLHNIGDNVMACWPRNAQNKNCPHRYKRFPAEIIEINNDSTYRLKYQVSPYLLSLLRPERYPTDYHQTEENKKQSAYSPSPDNCYAESVREMWVQSPANFIIREIELIEKKLGTPFYMKYHAELAQNWNNEKVIHWLIDIGVNKHIFINLIKLNDINGKQILSIQSENDKDLKIELNKLMIKKKIEKTDEDKTESVELDNNNDNNNDNDDDILGLNRIELRNLLSNIKHLKQQYELMQAQYAANDVPTTGKDYAKLQQVWQNFRKEMGRTGGNRGGGGGGGDDAANFEDTDTK